MPHHQRRFPQPSSSLPRQEFASWTARRLREDSVVTAAARRFPKHLRVPKTWLSPALANAGQENLKVEYRGEMESPNGSG